MFFITFADSCKANLLLKVGMHTSAHATGLSWIHNMIKAIWEFKWKGDPHQHVHAMDGDDGDDTEPRCAQGQSSTHKGAEHIFMICWEVTVSTRPSILCVTHQMSCKKRNYSVGWTVSFEMMNYKWYLMVLGQYMTILKVSRSQGLKVSRSQGLKVSRGRPIGSQGVKG